MSVTNPTPDDHIRWICCTSIDDGKQSIASLLRDRAKHTDSFLLSIFEKAIATEIHTGHRKSLIVALRSAIKKVTPMPTAPITTEIIQPKDAVLSAAAKAITVHISAIESRLETLYQDILPAQLKIGLHCLRAHQVFCIPDAGKRGQGRKPNNQVHVDVISPQGFEGWLATNHSKLKKPTAYRWMTALKGLGLSESATEDEVDEAIRQNQRIGPVTLKGLCAAAVDAIAPPALPAPNLQQTEFEFLKDGLKAFRQEAEQIIALKTQLEANPDMYRAACARAYQILHELTGTNWKPSDEPDDLASVDPDAINL